MARKAFVSSDMSDDEQLGDVASDQPLSALIWPWMITYLDDWGRGVASPKRIKRTLFADIDIITVQLIEETLQLYDKYGLMQLYSDGERTYMAIPSVKWFKWQTHIRNEKRIHDNSKYPPCPTDSAQMRADARSNANMREVTRSSAQIVSNRDPSPSPSLTPTSNDEEENKRIAIQQIVDAWEQTFGKIQGDPSRLMTLLDYMDKGVDSELIITIIHKSSNARSPLKYADSVLSDCLRRGISTVQSWIDQSKERSEPSGATKPNTESDDEWDRLEAAFYAPRNKTV